MLFRRAKPLAAETAPPKTADPPSYIAPDMVVTGDITVEGELRIDGLLQGKVRAHRCVIEGKGVVEGEIEADECVVRGRVAGPIRAYHVHLKPGADVEGDVISDTIAVDTGARIYDSIWRKADPFAALALPQPETPAQTEPAPPGSVAEPAEPSTSSSFSRNPLWSGADRDSYRPIKAVRPR